MRRGRFASYVDISNELIDVIDLLGMHDEAAASGKRIAAGAGHGFVGTESIVCRLCEGRPTPTRVRVDAIPYIAEGGVPLGEALAAPLVGLMAAGGREYEDGQLVHARVGKSAEALALPDGAQLTTAGAPMGDLEATRRASGAAFVFAAHTESGSRARGKNSAWGKTRIEHAGSGRRPAEREPCCIARTSPRWRPTCTRSADRNRRRSLSSPR